jgi:peptidoglycan hydrolase CwlO-like protein
MENKKVDEKPKKTFWQKLPIGENASKTAKFSVKFQSVVILIAILIVFIFAPTPKKIVRNAKNNTISERRVERGQDPNQTAYQDLIISLQGQINDMYTEIRDIKSKLESANQNVGHNNLQLESEMNAIKDRIKILEKGQK